MRIVNCRRWKRAAQIKMTLLPSKSCGGSVIKSTSSLGDETVPLYESIVTTKKRTVKNTVNLKRRETVKKAKSFKRTKSKLALIYNQVCSLFSHHFTRSFYLMILSRR